MKKVDIIQILVQLAILGVMAGTLIPIAQQSNAANRQTAYLAEQTKTLNEDYEKRTRAYLAVDGITVKQGNSNEYVDILISIKNFGQVPATKLTFGNVTEDKMGIIIGGKDVTYDESTGGFTFIYHGNCTNECPPCQPADKTQGSSFNITICACPCYIAAIITEDVPTDLIFIPGRGQNFTAIAPKSTYDDTIAKTNVMQIAFAYYYEGNRHHYIAKAIMTGDKDWIVQQERGD